MKKTLVILGAGGHGQTVAEVAEQTEQYDKIVFLDDNAQNVSGTCSEYVRYKNECTEIYPAFGDNRVRLNWEKKLVSEGMRLAKIIHPLAYISRTAKISEGCVVFPYAIINTQVVVKKACIINCGAVVDHGCIIEEGVHINPGAVVKAENRLPAMKQVESGEVVQIREYPL